TRAVRPPLRTREQRGASAARPDSAGGAPLRDGAAAARAWRSRALLPLPLRAPLLLLLPLPSGARGPHPPSLRPALSGCGVLCPRAGAYPRRLPARTEIPRPRPARSRIRTLRTLRRCVRSFSRLRVIGRCDQRAPWRRMRRELRFHVPVGGRARPLHSQLLEQERERLFQVGADRGADVGRQIPEASLERPDRFLAALINELLFGVAFFPFVFGFGFHPG